MSSFSAGIAEAEDMLSGAEDGLAFARRIIDGQRSLSEPWRSRFLALGRVPEFRDIQMRTMDPYLKRPWH